MAEYYIEKFHSSGDGKESSGGSELSLAEADFLNCRGVCVCECECVRVSVLQVELGVDDYYVSEVTTRGKPRLRGIGSA